MKKYLLILFSLFCLNAAFSQKEIPLFYSLEPTKATIIPVILRGPSADCQAVPLSLETTFDPEEGMINIIVRNKYEKPLIRKEQYTYLWFPIGMSGSAINEYSIGNHFKKNYRSRVVLGTGMHDQVYSSDYSGQSFLPAFQCENGEIQNQRQGDIMLSLSPEKVLLIKIKIQDDRRPVILKIRNVVPLKSRFEYPMIFNKTTLAYISDNFSISLTIPESNCYTQIGLIDKYKQWNKELVSDYEEYLNYLISNRNQAGSAKEIMAKKLTLLSKYETARKGVRETDCEELSKEFATFHKYYSKIGEGVVTADSLQRMLNEMDVIIDDISIARNKGNGKECYRLKEKVAKFNQVELSADVYDDYPEMKGLVKRFLDMRQLLNDIKCPGSGGNSGKSGGSTANTNGRCTVDTKKITNATMEINNLLNEYRVKKVKNEQKFYKVVREIDAYLKDIPDACKNSSKYRTVIQQYQDAKKAYQNAVK